MTQLEKIEKIAKETREWAEEYAHKKVQGYERFDSDLACMCGVCAFELFKRLKKAECNPIFAYALAKTEEAHCFVLVPYYEKKYIVDITATQFGETRKVMIRPLLREENQWWWQITDTAKTIPNIRKLFHGWPSEQKPLPFQGKI